MTDLLSWLFTPHLLTIVFWGSFVIGLFGYRHAMYEKESRDERGYWHRVKVPFGPQRTFWHALWSAVGTWAFVAFLAILAGFSAPSTKTSTWEYRDQPLVSLRTADGTSVDGVFVFGFGSINSKYEPVYVYYIEDNGAFVQRNLTGNIRIYEEDRADGVLRTNWVRIDEHVDASGWFYQHIAVAWGGDRTRWQEGTKEFHIPRGSVSHKIVIR